MASKKDQYKYPMDLQIYTHGLIGKCDVRHCIKISFDRIKLLQIVHKVIKHEELMPDEQIQQISRELQEEGLTAFAKLLTDNGHLSSSPEDLERRRDDHVSHFFLTLALCNEKNKSVRKWWFDGEMELFKFKLLALDDIGAVNFINLNHFNFPKVDERTRELLADRLSVLGDNFRDMSMFFVPWSLVTDLVAERSVYFHNHVAAVPATLVVRELHLYYHRDLEIEWANATFIIKLLDQISVNRVIQSIKDKFNRSVDVEKELNYVGPASKNPKHVGSILHHAQINEFAEAHFPPCMLKIHRFFLENHRLKNASRVQYIIFLKELGVPYQSTKNYFRREYIKVIKEKQFKEYDYYIRHLYGMVGSKIKYRELSCETLAGTLLQAGDCNGCPFALGDIEDLHKSTHFANFSKAKKDDIMKFSRAGKYNVACSRYYAAQHHCKAPRSIKNPTEFVLRSFKRKKKKEEKANRSAASFDSDQSSVVDLVDSDDDDDDEEEEEEKDAELTEEEKLMKARLIQLAVEFARKENLEFGDETSEMEVDKVWKENYYHKYY